MLEIVIIQFVDDLTMSGSELLRRYVDARQASERLKTAIRDAGDGIPAQTVMSFRELLERRERVFGLISQLCWRPRPVGEVSPDWTRRADRLHTVVEGLEATQLLILIGQYAKAAVALRQDIEAISQVLSLRRGPEVKKGQVLNLKAGPQGHGRTYGWLSDVAHLNVDKAPGVLGRDAPEGVPLASPRFVREAAEGFLLLHIANMFNVLQELIQLELEAADERDVQLDNITQTAHWLLSEFESDTDDQPT